MVVEYVGHAAAGKGTVLAVEEPAAAAGAERWAGRSHRFRRSRLRMDVDCRGGLVRGVGGLGAILLGLRLGLGLGGVGV